MIAAFFLIASAVVVSEWWADERQRSEKVQGTGENEPWL